jgi:hypothetical protein
MKILPLPVLLMACVLAPAAGACRGNWSANGTPPNPGIELTEIVHSPSGTAFALNASDGGIVGTWDVQIFIGRSAAAAERTLHPEVRQAVDSFPQCGETEVPNLGLAAWLKGGTEMLLIAEVPPHSSCTNMGSLRGLRVETATGRLLEQIPENVVRAKWKHTLGCRFLPQ